MSMLGKAFYDTVRLLVIVTGLWAVMAALGLKLNVVVCLFSLLVLAAGRISGFTAGYVEGKKAAAEETQNESS